MSLMPELRGDPIAIAAVMIPAAAFAFNVGFFTLVGLPFLTVFTLQEHIVFALFGASVSLVLALTLLVVVVLVKGVPFGRGGAPWQRIARAILRVISSAIGLLLALITASFYLPPISPDWSTEEIVEAFIFVLACASAGIVIYTTRQNIYYHYILSGVIVMFMYAMGLSFAINALNEKTRFTTATLSTGESAKLIRMGTEYTLVLNGSDVIAVPTESVDRVIRSKPW